MHILFFIGTLGTGGAERQIALLADSLAQRGQAISVVTLYPGGQNWEWLEKSGKVFLYALFPQKMSSTFLSGMQLALAVLRLRYLLLDKQPNYLYSFLYMSNLIAWLAIRGIPKIKLVWGIRSSSTQLNWKRSLPFHLCKFVSSSVPLLIANSKAGLADHENKGYRSKRGIVIPNGIDTCKFSPNLDAGIPLKVEWNVPMGEKLIGLVGRVTRFKAHPTFLQAAAIVAKERTNVRFVFIGDGSTTYRQELHKLAQKLGLDDRLIWAGERRDLPAVYNALDIVCLPSYDGEGFSNVIGEAMACGIPCVVTDVGDSAWIVGDAGIVVPPGQPEALAKAWNSYLDSDLTEIKIKARSRIVENFSLDNLVVRTLEELC